MGIRGVSGIGKGGLLEFEAKGGLFILGGEYMEQEEGGVGILFPEPTSDGGVFELFVVCFPVVIHSLK